MSITKFGTSDADTLVGDEPGENYKLFGYAGDDSLVGGDGNDTIDGGLGADSMLGGDGSDSFIIDQADLSVVYGSLYAGDGAWIDTISTTLGVTGLDLYLIGGERFLGGSGTDVVISSGPGSVVMLGNGGDDSLSGGVAADSLLWADRGTTSSAGASETTR